MDPLQEDVSWDIQQFASQTSIAYYLAPVLQSTRDLVHVYSTSSRMLTSALNVHITLWSLSEQ